MRSCKALFFISCLLLYLSFALSATAANGVIDAVQFDGSGDSGESVVFHLSNGTPPKSFALKGERPRIVFDFMGSQLAKTVPSALATDGNMVQKIRMGRHSDKTRVVLDLASGSDVSFEQHFDTSQKKLTIRIFSNDYPPKEEAVVQEEDVKEVADTERAVEEAAAQPVETEEVADKEQEAIGSEPAVAITAAEPVVEAEPADKGEEVVDVVPVAEDDPLNPEALLSEVSFENTSNKGEMVLFKLNGFYPPEVNGEEKGTPKVTCVFAGARMGDALVKEQQPKGEFVDKIVVKQKNKTAPVEVTLELVPHKNYDLQQVFFKEDNLFVIIVNSYDNMGVPSN